MKTQKIKVFHVSKVKFVVNTKNKKKYCKVGNEKYWIHIEKKNLKMCTDYYHLRF